MYGLIKYRLKNTPKINLVTVPFFNSLIYVCKIVPTALIFYFLGYFWDLLIVSITKPCRFESLLKHIVSNLRFRLLFLIMHHRNILSARLNLYTTLKTRCHTLGVHLNLPPTAPIRGRGAKNPPTMSKSTFIRSPYQHVPNHVWQLLSRLKFVVLSVGGGGGYVTPCILYVSKAFVWTTVPNYSLFCYHWVVFVWSFCWYWTFECMLL